MCKYIIVDSKVDGSIDSTCDGSNKMEICM